MDGVKIGIGVLTMGVRELHPKLFERSCGDIFIFTDVNREGPARGRNKILSHFKDYDHIFIFDDDCYPTFKGWEAFLIEEFKKHNIHWAGLPNFPTMQIKHIEGEMIWVEGCCGCFQYFSNKALKTIGGYNTAYNRYGFEDAALKQRAIKSGLTGKYAFPAFPLRGLSYIYSMDVNHDNPTPNIEMPEKQRLIALNHPIYLTEYHSKQVFYPYE